LASFWRALRRRILTPPDSETSLDKRGFNKKNPEAVELLETVGKKFLAGYAYAMEARTPAEAEERLEQIPEKFRGFAYEGAGMGFGMLDGLPGGGKSHVDDFLKGRGANHIYIIYVGVGWAMARLPRFAWPKPESLHPLLGWLALDGYGFHQAYFKTQKYVTEQYQDPKFPWPKGKSYYANKVIDQGIGRALWFVAGTDAELATKLIESFPADRHSDLYAGAGLAATYAGGPDEAELQGFADRAGIHRPAIAQGSAFAAECRVLSDLVTPHTHLATKVFCGTTPEKAAQVTIDLRENLTDDGDLPAYEVWRQRIANEFISHGGVDS
jgi:enediyne biosynthesis protein E3